ncbi:MAG TPA: flagellar biosynthetic protein FliR [Armatimonadota bacterium]|nr:flagellar biosynthetic protein FliR [Armatimonadota bacterium]
MELSEYLTAQVVVWMLVLARVSGIFLMAPVFASQQIPVQVRVMAALLFAAALAPLATVPPMPAHIFALALLLLREGLLGVALGFVPALFFLAFQYAAELIDLQVGVGMGGWVDPTFRIQVSPLGNFQALLATVLFLTLNGHHLLIEALARSFRLIPLGSFSLNSSVAQGITTLFGQVALFGIQVSAPILAVLLVTDIGMGILGRAAPQINLLIMSPSLKGLAALLALTLALPLFTLLMGHLIAGMRDELFVVIRTGMAAR